MWQKDEKLAELQQKTARKNYLKKLLADLHAQEKELKERVRFLDTERKREKEEFERIEGKTLSSFFYAIAGKREEQLKKEQTEAYAAEAKYESAMGELNAVREDIKKYNAEYKSLIGYDVQFEKLLREKEQALKASGSAEAARIVALEKSLAENEAMIEEINEAAIAGRRARKSADKVLDALNHSDTWASWDIFGGGMVADYTKQERLDAAQAAVGQLQIELRRFKTELAEIGEDAEIKENVSSFLRFADWFFDGVFVDYSILQRIDEAKERIKSIRGTLQEILSILKNKINVIEAKSKEIQAELDTLVLDTDV